MYVCGVARDAIPKNLFKLRINILVLYGKNTLNEDASNLFQKFVEPLTSLLSIQDRHQGTRHSGEKKEMDRAMAK